MPCGALGPGVRRLIFVQSGMGKSIILAPHQQLGKTTKIITTAKSTARKEHKKLS